ncbi:hypothetical protein Nepgr_024628 [Nepenthes gracilis]|uniref:TOD1/MUCI70 glycosyltransferase-like domain-containing protein n=1 Tax=Nepenthes gracilis TaxID=150966 RepID=A0AAD3Y089_NEPGR|nr:hypothetical protein Nepgr_024628 [Nepenthes gracilis]
MILSRCVSTNDFVFVRGTKPGHGTGIDIADADLLDMEQCHGIVVASTIFGTATDLTVSTLCAIVDDMLIYLLLCLLGNFDLL